MARQIKKTLSRNADGFVGDLLGGTSLLVILFGGLSLPGLF